uniref:Uncharacterized protein n=1 Tax=Rhizophora mucronata TaxID=61149 RepID=A0A2P2NN35_RHIMU
MSLFFFHLCIIVMLLLLNIFTCSMVCNLLQPRHKSCGIH